MTDQFTIATLCVECLDQTGRMTSCEDDCSKALDHVGTCHTSGEHASRCDDCGAADTFLKEVECSEDGLIWRVKRERDDEPLDDWDVFFDEGSAIEHAERLLATGGFSGVYITCAELEGEEAVVWSRYARR